MSRNKKFWVDQVTVPHPPLGNDKGWGTTKGGGGVPTANQAAHCSDNAKRVAVLWLGFGMVWHDWVRVWLGSGSGVAGVLAGGSGEGRAGLRLGYGWGVAEGTIIIYTATVHESSTHRNE